MSDLQLDLKPRTGLHDVVESLEQLTFVRLLLLLTAVATSGAWLVETLVGRQEPNLVLTASAPSDRGSHVICEARGVVEPRARIDEVTVTAICERLEDEEFEPTETAAPGESCEKCEEVPEAEDVVTCFTLGPGTHELRTRARGKMANADDDAPHRPDDVFSNNTLIVSCP